MAANTVTMTIRHRGTPGVHGVRFFHNSAGEMVSLSAGEEVEAELLEGDANLIRKQSASGIGELEVSGEEPEVDPEVEIDEETQAQQEITRAEVEQKEAENAEAASTATKARVRPARAAESGAPAGGAKPPTRRELGDMTRDQLRAHADSQGVDVPSGANKDDMIDAIVAARRRS